MSKKTIVPLYSAADAAAVEEILGELGKKGFRVREADAPKKGEVLLLFLSGAFAADEALQERFFDADSAGAAVVPVDLDGAAQPELVHSALMARNAIAAQGRTGEEIAARIAAAEAFAEKGDPKRLGRLLLAAALVLVLGAGVWIWHGYAEKRAAREAEAERVRTVSAAAARFGLQPEDLEQIESFALIGDHVAYSNFGYVTNSDMNQGNGLLFRLEDHAYESWEQDGKHWYSAEDGHEFTLTRYEDLELLRYMPKLRNLTLILVDTEALPSLAGLEKLEQVSMSDCVIPSYDWLSGATMFHLSVRSCAPADFSVLSSCEKLRDAAFDFSGVERADLSGFTPPILHYVSIRGDGTLRGLSLDGLRGCELREAELDDLPLEDLGFLQGQTKLSQLRLNKLEKVRDLNDLAGIRMMAFLDIDELRSLRDISSLGDMAGLQRLSIGNCPRITDWTPIGGCNQLNSFRTWGCGTMRSADFLRGKKLLEDIQLNECPLDDMDFLESFQNVKTYGRSGINFCFSGEIRDYSGLGKVRIFDELEFSVPGRNSRYGDASQILEYLANTTVRRLRIHSCGGLDLSALPNVSWTLEIDESDLRDLSGMPALSLQELILRRLPNLTSLNGVENLTPPAAGIAVCVDDCPRLADWEKLESMHVRSLELERLYTMPEMGGMNLNHLTLRDMSEVKDLHFLDSLPEWIKIGELKLFGFDELQDLSPLRRLKINYLAVPPQLMDQAEALVKAGTLGRYEPAFSEGRWERSDAELTLTSFEEMETMPEAMLRHVTRVCVAGDRIVDRDRYDIDDFWDNKGQHVILRERESGEETELKLGTMKDLSALEKLTGLRELEIYAQPIETLEGIQRFGELESLQVNHCPKLTDVSAAFTLQGLRCLGFGNSPVRSIQGVQNLHELHSFGVWGTKVSDLSPLRGLDTGAAEREGGFELSVGGLSECEDYTPIAAIGVLRRLDLNGSDCANWPELTELREIRALSAHGSHMDQGLFEKIVAAHPELEELQIPYNEKVTDLTPLLGMENLRRVVINREMKEAAASLQGRQLPFELEIW